MTVIKDGTGAGYVAEVNEINQLVVAAMTQPDVATGSDLGISWVANGLGAVTSGTERTVLILTNSGPNTVELGLTITSVQNPPMNSGIITTIKTYLGISTATGGSAVTPVNLNTQFNTLPNVGITSYGPTVTASDNLVSTFFFQMQDTQILDYQSTIVLDPGGSYRVTAIGGLSPFSGLVSHSIRFVNEFH